MNQARDLQRVKGKDRRLGEYNRGELNNGSARQRTKGAKRAIGSALNKDERHQRAGHRGQRLEVSAWRRHQRIVREANLAFRREASSRETL